MNKPKALFLTLSCSIYDNNVYVFYGEVCIGGTLKLYRGSVKKQRK